MQLSNSVQQDLQTTKYIFVRSLADTNTGYLELQSYQLASLLMLLYTLDIIHNLDSWAKLTYDIASNHVIVSDVDTSASRFLGLSLEDDIYYLDLSSDQKEMTSLPEFISAKLGILKYPRQLRYILKNVQESDYTYSLLNFICGCLYWQSHNMYHLILGDKVYALDPHILTDTSVDPSLYLADVPTPVFVEDFMLEFITIRDMLLSFDIQTAENITIQSPLLNGIIPESMWKLGSQMVTATTGKYELAKTFRQKFSNLLPLADPHEIIDTVYYDYGIVCD